MLRLGSERTELGIVDDQRGTPTYAPHLAALILNVAGQLKAVGDGGAGWGIYHAAGAGETSWYGFARDIFARSAALGGPCPKVKPIETKDYPTAAKRPANSRLDCSKLADKFGVSQPDWHVGVAACVETMLGPE